MIHKTSIKVPLKRWVDHLWKFASGRRKYQCIYRRSSFLSLDTGYSRDFMCHIIFFSIIQMLLELKKLIMEFSSSYVVSTETVWHKA